MRYHMIHREKREADTAPLLIDALIASKIKTKINVYDERSDYIVMLIRTNRRALRRNHVYK